MRSTLQAVGLTSLVFGPLAIVFTVAINLVAPPPALILAWLVLFTGAGAIVAILVEERLREGPPR